jgi:UDP-N-acetylmuramate dehydrogenase
VDNLVIKMETSGIEKIAEDTRHVLVKAEAGVDWPGLVDFCVSHGWGGIENLALIPGKVGTSPMQNIGAYGVELKDVFYELEAYEISSGMVRTFSGDECQFGYRDSYFKKEGKNEFIILSVTLMLSKSPELKLDYGALREEVLRLNPHHPGIKDVRDAVVAIRRSKLPDPAILGNAGSFFKNPTVSGACHQALKTEFPAMVSYLVGEDHYKLAAGWLIDYCGWKGKRLGDAGVHEKQALVLVNHGKATGQQVLALSGEIKSSVQATFGVELETEVNIF